MPEQYQNPTTKPCAGTYTWVPTVSPQIGGVNPTLGFENLIIDRGAFRNYYLKPKELPNAKDPEAGFTIQESKSTGVNSFLVWLLGLA